MMNPDGYAYTHIKVAQPLSSQRNESFDEYLSLQNRLWRKNRKPLGTTNCAGVDLGRHFPFRWHYMGSMSPCSDTSPGDSSLTENEVKAIERYVTGQAWNA